MKVQYEDFKIHLIGLFLMIIFWMTFYKVCEKLKFFTEDDLFFNSKTLSFYCICVPIVVAYSIALILEFIELYNQ
ncbi:hypothetical protein Flavo103_13940 [Flavobacterium collinsii]|jgi:hypothetical protein|nr:hypothetical protein Flavo103_13940 [Flavobacterium collinsii]